MLSQMIGLFFDSVLSYKVEVQIKRYKAIVKYSESQTI